MEEEEEERVAIMTPFVMITFNTTTLSSSATLFGHILL